MVSGFCAWVSAIVVLIYSFVDITCIANIQFDDIRPQ